LAPTLCPLNMKKTCSDDPIEARKKRSRSSPYDDIPDFSSIVPSSDNLELPLVHLGMNFDEFRSAVVRHHHYCVQQGLEEASATFKLKLNAAGKCVSTDMGGYDAQGRWKGWEFHPKGNSVQFCPGRSFSFRVRQEGVSDVKDQGSGFDEETAQAARLDG
jgi:hypothetical protein